jgi:hypothetical protein
MLSLILVLFACPSQRAVDEGSCNGDELEGLLEVCVSYGGSFDADTSASGLEDCDVSVDVLLQSGGGACRIKGSGDCEVACRLPDGSGSA